MSTDTPTDPNPVPTRVPDVSEPRSLLGRWLMHGGSPEEASHVHDAARPWYAVLWLTGVDYFSTLGYQPGIALVAAGVLSPLATAILVFFTLFGALPVYHQVAQRSFVGQGSIAMLERLLHGWRSKFFVLVLLGFASTAFVITVTLSAADAAEHIVENPLVEHALHGTQLWVTLALLALLAAVFLRGFSEAIGLAVAVGVPYILLNVVVVIRGLIEISRHPHFLTGWSRDLFDLGDWTHLFLLAGLAFPKLALGLSGFETGVAVMPLVKGDSTDASSPVPWGRVRNTRRLLTTAALIMSVLLLTTSFITAVLVPREAYQEGGPAAGRVLAFLTHQLMGPVMGTIYDISTILILWFAGASAITGMLNLVPRYLPRFGMAPRWVAYARPLVLVLFVAEVLVTLAFQADVYAQGGAYATGVLVLMLSGSVAVALALWREALTGTGEQRTGGRGGGGAGGNEQLRIDNCQFAIANRPEPQSPVPPSPRRIPWASLYFWLVTAGFVYAIVENVRVRPDGVIIAALFIFFIVLLSALSRWVRATELRVESLTFVDGESERLWPELMDKKVNLVPLKRCDRPAIGRKAEEIRQHYTVQGPLAFLHVDLADDRSDFASALRVKVSRLSVESLQLRDESADKGGHAGLSTLNSQLSTPSGDYLIEVAGAVALANVIAYISELIDPISIFLGLTRQNSVSQAFRYLLWGEGETGILVYEILLRHWEQTPEDDVRPLIFIMSE